MGNTIYILYLFTRVFCCTFLRTVFKCKTFFVLDENEDIVAGISQLLSRLGEHFAPLIVKQGEQGLQYSLMVLQCTSYPSKQVVALILLDQEVQF